jgi:hypothetical protein
MENYAGVAEFLLVALFAMAWGVLELVGKRLDRKKAAAAAEQQQRQDTKT